jgi:hypothetical protein
MQAVATSARIAQAGPQAFNLLFKYQFVKLLAEPHSEPLRRHHEDKDTTSCTSHKDYFKIFFKQHKQMPCHRYIVIQR